MKILLTNDDGYNSKGIEILRRKLAKYGQVVVVAPLNHMSAKSVSITLGKGIKVEKVEKDVFVIDATPADCVSFGLSALDIEFDLVVSGCNNGFNISYDTLYSGTVGAALEALTHRVKAVAFSCEFNFDIVEEYFDEVFEYILSHHLLSNEYILNVNFPLGDIVRGIKLSTLYYYSKNTAYYVKKDDGYHVYRTLEDDYSIEPNSDCYLVRNGYVSITPLNKSLFDKTIYNELKEKIK